MEGTPAGHQVQFLSGSPHFMPACKAPGIPCLHMMHVFACAFMRGREAAWKLQFF